MSEVRLILLMTFFFFMLQIQTYIEHDATRELIIEVVKNVK